MAIVARHFRITGKVQGVGYRYFTQCTARELGLVGWVRNMPDGSVEAWAKGPATVIATFHQELSFGPYNAQVSDVEISDADSSVNYSDFRILR